MQADRVPHQFHGLAGAGERARDIVEVLERRDEAAQPPAGLLGLDAAEIVERNVALPLQARLGVPIGLAVADEIERVKRARHGVAPARRSAPERGRQAERDRATTSDAHSLSSVRSGASGFFMPTTW